MIWHSIKLIFLQCLAMYYPQPHAQMYPPLPFQNQLLNTPFQNVNNQFNSPNTQAQSIQMNVNNTPNSNNGTPIMNNAQNFTNHGKEGMIQNGEIQKTSNVNNR